MPLLSVCCNDYRNGSFSGRADAFQFESGGIELTVTGRGVKFFWVAKSKFTIGGKKRPLFECSGITHWVGNWCWDSCTISTETATQVAKLLKTLGYVPESGTAKAWEDWERI